MADTGHGLVPSRARTARRAATHSRVASGGRGCTGTCADHDRGRVGRSITDMTRWLERSPTLLWEVPGDLAANSRSYS